MNPQASVLFLVLAFITTSEAAQHKTDSQSVCPRVAVSLSEGSESQLEFQAIVSGITPDQKLSYSWSVHNGHIKSGQGTRAIVVEGIDAVTATVEVKGAPVECTGLTASASFLRGPPPPPVRTVASFGPISFSKVKQYLDKLAWELENQPGATGRIISNRRWTLSKRATHYLVREKKLDSERIFYVEKAKDGPLRVTLYLVPLGAAPPS